jgi:hypothetical protein
MTKLKPLSQYSVGTIFRLREPKWTARLVATDLNDGVHTVALVVESHDGIKTVEPYMDSGRYVHPRPDWACHMDVIGVLSEPSK